MKDVVILSSVRSPGGAFGGALKGMTAPELGVRIAREAIQRSGVEPEHFDETIIGHGWQAGVGPNSARLISVGAGLPNETPAYTINKRCGSSIKAAALAAQAIRAGDADVVLAGGVESTSNVPFVNPGARWGNRFGHAQFLDLIYKDGYEDPLSGQLMGVTAENLVERYNLSREEQDEYALESQEKALAAIEGGRFAGEIAPIEIKGRKGEVSLFDKDETPRSGMSMEKLGRLKPVFDRWGNRFGHAQFLDLIYKDGYEDPLSGQLMGVTAENLVERYNLSREEQDEYALESHEKALAAIEGGRFAGEIAPIEIKGRKGEVNVFDKDETPRSGMSMEKLGRLKPVFDKNGSVTPGNSCCQADAASALVLASKEKADELGAKPVAILRGYASTGVEPRYMGLGPVTAIPKALERAGLSLADMDLIEVNEAFAAQVIACERELEWDRKKLNVHGGAIALGHPVGATGGKIIATCLSALAQRNEQFGVVSACIGGGQGVAVVLERVA